MKKRIPQETYEEAALRYTYDPEKGLLYNKEKRAVGAKRTDGYLDIGHKDKNLLVHRLVFVMYYGYLPNQIDHINQDKTDNRIDNLRGVSRRENAMNNPRRKGGVYWDKRRNKWYAKIQKDKKQNFLGYFSSRDEALAARRDAELTFFGDYAPLEPPA